MVEKVLLSGVLPALVTPLDEAGRVKTDLAKPLLDLYRSQEADGVYMLGWTGEGAYISVEQRKLWAEAVLKAAKGFPVFVHVGYNQNLDDSVELASHAASNGAFAIASVGISEEAGLEENVRYFKRISKAAPSTPFYVYWTSMGKTLTGGRNVSPKDLLAEMDAVPTFRGIKFTDNNFYILERLKKYRPSLNILTGADELAVCSQIFGADGNIGALQGITCYHHKLIWNRIKEGNVTEARALQFRANEVSEAYQVPLMGALPGIKRILEGFYHIPVGSCAPGSPYRHQTEDKAAAENLFEVFKKNIIVK